MSKYYDKYLKYKKKYLMLQGGSVMLSSTLQYNVFVLSGDFARPNIESKLHVSADDLMNRIGFLNAEIKRSIFDHITNQETILMKEAIATRDREIIAYAIKNPGKVMEETPLGINKKMNSVLDRMNTPISMLYDKANHLYKYSQDINDYFAKKSIEHRIQITVFNGSNEYFKGIASVFYKTGINILMGCSTNREANNLNGLYNKIGKYFVGYNNFIHAYGNDVYSCNNLFGNLDYSAYQKIMDSITEEKPIIKLIKLFYYRLHNCKKCRDCSLFDDKLFDNNMLRLKGIIESTKSISEDESYFKGDNNYKPEKSICTSPCTITDCTIDVNFENFFSDILNAYQQKEDDKKIKSDLFKLIIEKKNEIHSEKKEKIKKKLDEHINQITDNSEYIKIDIKKLNEYTITLEWIQTELAERIDISDHTSEVKDMLRQYDITNNINDDNYFELSKFQIERKSLAEYAKIKDINKILYNIDDDGVHFTYDQIVEEEYGEYYDSDSDN